MKLPVKMRSRKRFAIFALLVVIIAVAIHLFLTKPPPEPAYNDRPLSAWLDDLSMPQFSPGVFLSHYSRQSSDADAQKAFKAFGPRAIPFIIRKLEENDSPWLNKYRELWPKLPAFFQKHLSKPKDIEFSSGAAASAFEMLGTNAVPYLLPWLKDHNPAVREAVISALGDDFLPRQLLTTNQAISIAQRMLSDNDATVRLKATCMLQRFGPAASNAVPALILALNGDERGRDKFHNERVFVRSWAAIALGKMGPVAADALPALTNLLAATNADSYIKTCAAEAVWLISSNENLCLPALISCLQSTGPPYNPLQHKTRVVGVLKEMGPHAKAALPDLVKEMSTTDTDLHEAITNAILSIDPAEATNFIRETVRN